MSKINSTSFIYRALQDGSTIYVPRYIVGYQPNGIAIDVTLLNEFDFGLGEKLNTRYPVETLEFILQGNGIYATESFAVTGEFPYNDSVSFNLDTYYTAFSNATNTLQLTCTAINSLGNQASISLGSIDISGMNQVQYYIRSEGMQKGIMQVYHNSKWNYAIVQQYDA